MKLILAALLVSGSAVAAALPNSSTLVDQTVAQAHSRSVAEHYAEAAIPRQQAAPDPTREEEYRRIQEDMQKWFPRCARLESKNRDFRIRWNGASALQHN